MVRLVRRLLAVRVLAAHAPSKIRGLRRNASLRLYAVAGIFSLLAGCVTPAATGTGPTVMPTAAVSVPLPTPSPLPSAAPSPQPVPARPARLQDEPAAVASYLNAAVANRGMLLALLVAWDGPPPKAQPNALAEGDLDGDGEPEIVLALTSNAPADQSAAGSRGVLSVLRRVDSRYRVVDVPDGSAAPADSGPRLLAVDDLNGDGRAEIAFELTTCGAHSCVQRPRIVGWDANGRLRVLSPPDLEMASAQVQLVPHPAEHSFDLVLHGGLIGSAGAGIQRARTEVYRWQNPSWSLAETTYAPSRERYFVLADAGAAFTRRDFQTALRLYCQAAEDDSLIETPLAHTTPPGPELRAFARFRLVLIDALVGQEDDARALLEAAQRLDSATAFPRLALVFWDTYGMTADVQLACDQVTRLVRANPQPTLRSLNGWGYANPEVAPEDVCRPPGA
jgi:hypothetical protein